MPVTRVGRSGGAVQQLCVILPGSAAVLSRWSGVNPRFRSSHRHPAIAIQPSPSSHRHPAIAIQLWGDAAVGLAGPSNAPRRGCRPLLPLAPLLGGRLAVGSQRRLVEVQKGAASDGGPAEALPGRVRGAVDALPAVVAEQIQLAGGVHGHEAAHPQTDQADAHPLQAQRVHHARGDVVKGGRLIRRGLQRLGSGDRLEVRVTELQRHGTCGKAPCAQSPRHLVGQPQQLALEHLGIIHVALEGLLRAHALGGYVRCHGTRILAAGQLCQLSRGEDARPVTPHVAAKGMSTEETFERDVDDPEVLKRELLRLSDKVARRLRAGGFAARTVTLKLRYANFQTITRSQTLEAPTDETTTLHHISAGMVDALRLQRVRVRLIGLGVSGLVPVDASRQLDLLGDDRWKRIDRASDAARERFGGASITRGALLDLDEAPLAPNSKPPSEEWCKR